MTNLTQTIDALGALKAQIADLQAQEKAMKDALTELGAGTHHGNLFQLTITMPEREKPSDELKARTKEAVEAFRATLSHQYLTHHAPMVASPTLTLRARKAA